MGMCSILEPEGTAIPGEEGVGGNLPAQNTPFTPLRKIRMRTCWSSRSWARASSSWRGQRPYSQTSPSLSLATPWRTLSHLTDEDVPQGISGMRSVHQNFSDSCKGQAALSELGSPAQSEMSGGRRPRFKVGSSLEEPCELQQAAHSIWASVFPSVKQNNFAFSIPEGV